MTRFGRLSLTAVCVGFLLVCTSVFNSVLAVTLNIIDAPSILETDEFTVKFLVTGAKPATNYFRILLYPDGARTYLAQTWNGSSWYDGSDGKTYYPFAVSTSSASGEIKAKLKQGVVSGNYLISLKRYTASGSSANDEVSPRSVIIKRSTQEQQIIKTQDSPLSTSTPEPSGHPSSTVLTKSDPEALPQKVEATPEQTVEPIKDVVLTASSSVISQSQPISDAQVQQNSNTLAIIAGVVGVLLTFIGGYRFFSEYKRWYTERTDES